MVIRMKVTVNNIPVDLPEMDIFKLSRTEEVTIPETEGIFCWHCGCPVRFNMKSPVNMMGRCVNCSHVMMQHRSYGQTWENAGVVLFAPMDPRARFPTVVCAIGEQKTV
jgi:hypothetical protein